MHWAKRGKCSQIWMPGTFVLIGLNSPRISEGASILRSNMSWCDGPPGRKIMMIALCERRRPDCVSAWSSCGRVSPPKPSAPILRKLRREMPSQKRVLFPRIVSIKSLVYLPSNRLASTGPKALPNHRLCYSLVKCALKEIYRKKRQFHLRLRALQQSIEGVRGGDGNVHHV